MLNKKILLVLAAFILFAWAPWISKERAEQEIGSTVVQACGMSCSYCGVTAPKKIPFGYEATMEASCGAVAKKNLYLTLLGTIHGMQ